MSLRIAKVNNDRPAASLVANVFECFYIEQPPDAETSRSACWFPGETCYVSMYNHVFNQRNVRLPELLSRERALHVNL